MTKQPIGRYGVGTAARLTRLSEHVIRAWERRYDAIQPVRTKSGARRYSDRDIERLKLLRDAVDFGHRIGGLAHLTNEEVGQLVVKPARHDMQTALDEMLDAVCALDKNRLEQLLAREAIALGPFDFCSRVTGPLLDGIGERWARRDLCVASEHMATTSIKNVLMSLLRFGADRVAGDTMVFSTLLEERHELGALMAAVCAQDAGGRTLYLGPDLPTSELAWAARQSAAKVVAVSAIMPATADQVDQLIELRESLPRGTEIWTGGRGWTNVPAPAGVRSVGTLVGLRQLILGGSAAE